jgi:catechol 2,3-dioxygenase-like lactoylglutathione lyase family enzyme
MVNHTVCVQLIREPAMTETTAAPAVTGFHHFSPTVSDVEAGERVFGMNRVPVTFPHYGAEEDGYAVLLMDPRSGIAIGLHHHDAEQPLPYSVVVFRDPDNIRLELFHMAS